MTTPHRFVAGAIDLSELKHSTSNDSAPNAITADNFEAEVVQKSLQYPVFLHVGSQRSSDSVALDKTMQSLQGEFQNQFVYTYVDADATPDIAQAVGTQVLPTTIVLAAGQQLTRFEGNQAPEQLKHLVGSVLQATAGKLQGGGDAPEPQAEDPRILQAADAIRQGDYAAAIATYDELLAENNTIELRQAKAQALLLQRAATTGGGTHSIQHANDDATNVQAVLDTADFEVLSGRPTDAFQRLTAAIRVNFGADREELKQRLFSLFELFDDADPAVLKARQDLASALF